MNSRFQHDIGLKATYREISTALGTPNTYRSYAELDHIFANVCALSNIKHVVAKPAYCLESHHCPLEHILH